MKNTVSFIAFATAALLALSGCSHKEFYKPDNIKGDWQTQGRLSSPVTQTSEHGALLENGKVLFSDGEKDLRLPEGFKLINVADSWVIAQDPSENLVLIPQEGSGEKVLFEFKRSVASASVQGDILAVLFANNEMAIYSLQSKKLLYKESANPTIAVDARIANPYFLKELVLFLTLDGKIVIVNSETKQALRSVVVSSEDYFNNITYMNVVDNHLVAATGSGVLAFSQKEFREKYDLRNIAYTKDGVWLTTKQGEIIALSPTLQFKAKKKFPFAHFVGLSVQNDRVYALEQGGYLIALTKNLLSYDVFQVDVDTENKVFASDERFYFGDRYINLK